jgi:DNA-binding winged helix-turn-helix (wHTH) protein/Tol biopolymer transport system component
MQQFQVRSSGRARFGLFEADFRSGELRRSGIRVRLQAQPFRVLALLLERAGQVVSRDELQHYLWGQGTVVDFEHSLGTAINKIRDALSDSADNPRFIETLAKRGYRFIAPVNFDVEVLEPLAQHPAAHPVNGLSKALRPVSGISRPKDESLSPTRTEEPVRANQRPSVGWWLAVVALAALIVIAGMTYVVGLRTGRLRKAPMQISHVTFSGRVSPGDTFLESFPATATDGARIFFPELDRGRARVAQALIADGDSTELTLPGEIVAPLLCDISPDGSELLIRNHIAAETEQALWIVPTLGGAARQVPDVMAHDAAWMPDQQRILFANGNSLWTAGEDGTAKRLFAQLPGRAFWMRWAPSRRVLRLTLLNSANHTTALWELDANGKGLHPLLPGWSQPASECCGSWTSDARNFVFESHHIGDNIWMLGHDGSPIQLTNGPLDYHAPITSRDGHDIFFVGADTRAELLEYQSNTRQFGPFGDALNTANRVVFSRDQKWMAWVSQEQSALWRSRVDGTERIQLTSNPEEVFMMNWSPDGKQLVFMAREPGKRWQIEVIDADGGNLRALFPEDRNQADPDWSSDGKDIVFGRVPGLMGEVVEAKELYIFHLSTKKVETIPGSTGLFSPRWSPDGRFIAALSLDMNRLMLYDTAAKRWRVLTQQSAADPMWAHDSGSLFFHDYLQKSQTVYRISVSDGAIERVADLKDLRFADAVDYQFAGLTPRDALLVSARMSTANLYSLRILDGKEAMIRTEARK